MKTNILILIFFFTVSDVFCQNLSLSQVLKAREMSIGEVEEYLTEKGWKYSDGEEPSKDDLGVLSFAYKVSTINDMAESWIYYYFSENSEIKRIAIQILNNEKYNEYLNQIKNWCGKMIDSYFKDKEITKIYKGSTMTYVITTSTNDLPLLSKQTVYSIIAMTNEDYIQSK